ncbi:Hvo_1808 family surface protein [Haloarculaceae archaeon H-GB11]|nr:Hvo_1808 family surface protein [Haloarculaceae archaeon H-GB11]
MATENAPAPETDRLGWENGYWHNATLSITPDDGLNESERAAVVARAMARVEVVRGLEFERDVSIDVTTRATYANQTSGDGTANATQRTFENVRAEALFLVGEQRDSVAVRQESMGQSVLGYYSPSSESIVLVSDSETPRITNERTLAHELTHALQDQHFGIGGHVANTSDARKGRLGLVEGDAMLVEDRYIDRCGETWDCVQSKTEGTSVGGASSRMHMGLYLAAIFPYVDGPVFVTHLHDRGGWDAVNAAYERAPSTTAEVISPERYPTDADAVQLRDESTDDWERVRPAAGDGDRLGQALLSTMFMYTLYDEFNRSAAVDVRTALNVDDDGTMDQTDPLNYALPATTGWTGDRFHAYRNGERTGYVLQTTWRNASEAGEFAEAYRGLLSHWGGERVGPNRWRVGPDSPFTDAYAVIVDGETVTVVNAPTTDALGEVYGPAGPTAQRVEAR